MKLSIDTDNDALVVDHGDGERRLDLYTPEAFSELSRLWVTVGWGLRYTYGFTWMGRPIIQLPEDLITVQEVIYRVKPDVIIETGVAHGGSLVFYASLFEAMGSGHVVGVDIEIRPHNRTAIEAHELAHRITLIEGSSTDPYIVDQVRATVPEGATVMVLLDSDHSYQHVIGEMDAYAGLVTADSYLVVTDGVMEWLEGVPGAKEGWDTDNPKKAVESWLPAHPEFELEEPPPILFNEGRITERITHWPSAYLRRRS